MRLKRNDDAAAEGACGGQHRRDLRRMMAVVVDDEDAAGFAADVEAPLRAAELFQSRGHAIERKTELHADGHGGQRVQQVVPPRHVRASASRAWPASVADVEPGARLGAAPSRSTLIGPVTTSVAMTSAAAESRP